MQGFLKAQINEENKQLPVYSPASHLSPSLYQEENLKTPSMIKKTFLADIGSPSFSAIKDGGLKSDLKLIKTEPLSPKQFHD